ncbi:hypothetical protein [Roseivirga pacifica]|uniref:hypothetical protein n=1 Tax=Roseivirga pacifica TaxID=1267423 RepID=UPI003BAF1BCF
MTLIATTSNYSYPILLGDILLSSGSKNVESSVPTFLKNIDDLLPEDQTLFPFRLRQKVLVLSDLVAVGFAGSEYEIKLFLEDLRGHIKYRGDGLDEIKDFLNEYDFSEFKNLAALLLVARNDSGGFIIETASIGSPLSINSPLLEQVYAIGSGAKRFISEALESKVNNGNDAPNSLVRALAVNYTTLATFLGVERLTLDTIKDHWGAGFELVYFDGSRFVKLEDISYFIFNCELDLETGEFKSEPFLIINNRYFGEHLVMTVTDIKTTNKYLVPPLDFNIDEIDPDKFPEVNDFNSLKVCCFFFIRLSSGDVITPTFYHESPSFPAMINVSFDEEGHMLLAIREDLNRMVSEITRDLINRGQIRKKPD